MNMTTEMLNLFNSWLADAKASPEVEPTAMTLATAEPESGRVSARMILLKGIDQRGFVFYTNTTSSKGHQLAAHPRAALIFYWKILQRQIRIEGQVTSVKPAEADAYFASRDRGSQIGAWASQQSQTLSGGPDELSASVALAEQRYFGDAVPRPPHWSGYRVEPELVEFWQGQLSRLHDRFVYEIVDKQWRKRWLFP